MRGPHSAPDSKIALGKIALGAVGDLRDRVCDHDVHHDGNQEGFEVVGVQRSVQLRLREDDASAARPFIRHTKQADVIDAIIAGGVDAEFEEDLLSIFDFSAKLSTPPPEAAADVQALGDVGLDEQQQLDLVFSSAIFGWANRLMHTLGEPVQDQGTQPPEGPERCGRSRRMTVDWLRPSPQ
ncbi:hypothetical protein [Rhizobium leguminosarum]|uniref:hypothetical protein n=1 Tax=Rhizobium leguminosarum TaxID=384 RepID=UPI001FDF77DC|nr:hypothetical protein [Rhizobium leguminosarum]